MKDQILVFTDLDGTLLNHQTYSFDPARPALLALKEREIPLVICTSKTRAEIDVLRRALLNADPFISENGGAIFVPVGYFPIELPQARKENDYHVIELGTSYARLVEVLSRIKKRLPGQVRSFSDLSVEEVGVLANLTPQDAALAKEREYDEPFLVEDPSAEEMVRAVARSAGLKITQGSRFFHLMGDNDKGKAVKILKSFYIKAYGGVILSIGLGDSLNDLPLLEAVDFPVLVQKPGGRYDPLIRLSNLVYAPGEGPYGWGAAVLDILERLAL